MKKLPFPLQVLQQHVIALAKTRSGKSSAMRLIVEYLLDNQKPVCIIDPKGDWWGIKSSADGKKAGYSLVIFGGEHADVPINAQSGAHVAELVATGNRPCLIDLGGWTVADRTRFFIDFASTLFKLSKGVRYLVIDEVHNFAPKAKIINPEAGMMLHWANRLASEGLGKGITMIAASQRPQKVHNDLLDSCETLIAMRVVHPAARAALKEWMDGCADPEVGKQLLTTLASMKRGEAFIWSPEAGFGPERVTFPMFSTYDSFSPQKAHAAKLKGWADVDLEEVKAKLADVVQEAEKNNPKRLQAQIADLRRQLAAAQKVKPAAAPAPKEIPVPVIDKRVGVLTMKLENRLGKLQALFEHEVGGLKGLVSEIDQLVKGSPAIAQLPANKNSQVNYKTKPAAPVRSESSNPSTAVLHLSGPEQRILDALAWFKALGIHDPYQTAVAFLAGYTAGGGAFNNPRGRLRQQGLIEYLPGDKLALTDAGEQLADMPDVAPTNAELQARVLERLDGPMRKILQITIDHYPESIGDEQLASQAGYSAGGGAFNNPRGRLRTLGLITYPASKQVRAADLLFPENQ